MNPTPFIEVKVVNHMMWKGNNILTSYLTEKVQTKIITYSPAVRYSNYELCLEVHKTCHLLYFMLTNEKLMRKRRNVYHKWKEEVHTDCLRAAKRVQDCMTCVACMQVLETKLRQGYANQIQGFRHDTRQPNGFTMPISPWSSMRKYLPI